MNSEESKPELLEATVLIRLSYSQYFSIPDEVRLLLAPNVIKADPGDFLINMQDKQYVELYNLKKKYNEELKSREFALRELRRKQEKQKK